MMFLMAIAYSMSTLGLAAAATMLAPAVFAFGLVAFGFLGMGPVTIAVDSYGPVTDNAQSVYELSLIEQVPNVEAEIKNDFNMPSTSSAPSTSSKPTTAQATPSKPQPSRC